MWTLIIRSPDDKPRVVNLTPGANFIGRRLDNDIVLKDLSVSRKHCEIYLDVEKDLLRVQDVGSSYGTFVNRQRLDKGKYYDIQAEDVVKVGTNEITVTYQDMKQVDMSLLKLGDSREITRQRLMESLDNHAVLMYEIIQKLNTIFELDNALEEISRLIQRFMGADRCVIIPVERLEDLNDLGFPETIARRALKKKEVITLPNLDVDSDSDPISESIINLNIKSILCAPAISNDEIRGLIYMYKNTLDAKPFSEQDIQLSVAIGHLAALTIERVDLINQFRKEQKVRQLLERFLAPSEAERVVHDFMQTGRLPGLQEQKATILFADIANSTALAEKLGAQSFSKVLNRYYQDMTDIVFQHGGLVDKYLGDGIMAVFGVSSGKQNHQESNAVRSALEMLESLEKNYRADGKITVGIGINTGPVMAGYVSTKERVELSVLGDTVNVASGLQDYARPNRIFIGPQTFAAINGNFKTRHIGAVDIKGRTEKVFVNEVLKNIGDVLF